jgi:hypothetical protein
MTSDALRQQADDLITQAREAAACGDQELADGLTERALELYQQADQARQGAPLPAPQEQRPAQHAPEQEN